MDSRRWQDIQTTFDTLVALDERERQGRLAVLASTDPELRRAIESLLAADAEASARLAPLEAALPQSTPTPDPLGLSGRTVSHFEVRELLGAGGMGVVYGGQDTRLGRPVALKFLLPHYSLDAAAKARFLREAHAAAALDHPHLCTIYDVGESDDGRLFLAMALYQGETLRARLARDGPLPVRDALAITTQIAHGLGCAHAAGIVHRDLKPGNVMLLPDGTVKILDFGIAKVRDQTTSEAGTRLGTVAYMAPEQIRGQPVDARADLWAVGVVLYEMLTAHKPFAGEHEVAIAHAILHDKPVPPSTLRDGLASPVEEIVLRLLQKEPAARYAAVGELMADLAALGAPGEQPASGVAPTRWLRTRHTHLAKRSWIVTLGAAAVVGIAGSAAMNAGPDGATWLRLRSPGPVSRYAIALPDAQALDATAGGLHFRIAISPDGERLVYVGTSADGDRQLWVRRRDQLNATPLAGTEGAVFPFFSPDGSRVGFVAAGTPPAIKVVSLAGGALTTVIDSVVDGGGAWGHDGYIYFDAHVEGDGIARVAENGGAPEPITRTDYANGEGWHFQPEPLPNGKGVLFVISRGGGVIESDVAVVDLKSGVHRVLVRGVSPRYARSGHLLYVTADGALKAAPFDQDKLVLTGEPVVVVEDVGSVRGYGMNDLTVSTAGTFVYTVAPPPVSELAWVTRNGRATPIDSAWRAVFTSLALSPDGSALAVGVREGIHNHVWIKPLGRGPASKLTFDGGYNDHPAWTPDGLSVGFVSNRRASWDVYVGPVDGNALPRVLRDETGYLHEVEFSRDGQWLVYREGFDLYAVRTAGDTARTPLVETPAGDLTPRLSPDGRWLAYSTYEESGWREVFVAPFPNTGSARWQISRGGGQEPVWSRSGRELFYKNGRMELVAATVLPGATFAIGEQRVLFPTAQYVSYPAWQTYDVSPDGKRFVMIRPITRPRDELIWVENFFEELRAKVKR